MPKNAPSDSDTQETDSNPSSSSEEELESPKNGGTTQKNMSAYEKQRARRIEENRARMEALGLRKMASSVMGSGQIAKEKKGKGKGKRGEEDDDEYRPEEEEGASSSSGEDGEGEGSSRGSKDKFCGKTNDNGEGWKIRSNNFHTN